MISVRCPRRDTGGNAAIYTVKFRSSGKSFDRALEKYLDSDQVTTIARENEAKADDVSDLEISLQETSRKGVLPAPPARWVVACAGSSAPRGSCSTA